MDRKLLVLGIGNVLMGDEGVGVHAVRGMAQDAFSSHVAFLDGGTGGFQLLSYFEEYPEIIMIDATMDGRAPGTLSLIRPRFASDFPRSLSAHDIGLRDLIEAASLLGSLPRIHLITVSIGSVSPMVMELSPATSSALPGITSIVRQILDSAPDRSSPACYSYRSDDLARHVGSGLQTGNPAHASR